MICSASICGDVSEGGNEKQQRYKNKAATLVTMTVVTMVIISVSVGTNISSKSDKRYSLMGAIIKSVGCIVKDSIGNEGGCGSRLTITVDTVVEATELV